MTALQGDVVPISAQANLPEADFSTLCNKDRVRDVHGLSYVWNSTD
jgi:hypothetical protein